MPLKPTINSGIVIAETNEVFFVNNQTGEERSEPIIIDSCRLNPVLNKNIIHSNPDWNEILKYIKLLENAVSKRMQKELFKFRSSSKILNEKANLYGL